MLRFLSDSKLMSSNQSGSHMLNSFYESFEKSANLQIIVWTLEGASLSHMFHLGLTFLLQQNLGNVIRRHYFLYDRKQRVVLNFQISCSAEVNAEVALGSMGLIRFLIYIIDLPSGVFIIIKVFANDILSSQLIMIHRKLPIVWLKILKQSVNGQIMENKF